MIVRYINVHLLLLLLLYNISKIMGSRPWLFEVTIRHQSRDHSTRGGRFLTCGLL